MKLELLLKEIHPIACNKVNPVAEITGICYDSRTVVPGAMFVAIRGFHTDGHKYIDQALEAGAAIVVCEQKLAPDIPHVVVGNSRQALAALSAGWFEHPARRLKVLGVTGTNGKTTTTYLMKAILESKGYRVGLIGTNEVIVGGEAREASRTTPESYDLQHMLFEMAEAHCTHVVMEVSSHALCLDRVAGIRFAVGAFTNLTQDHLDFHKTMEAYRDAKAVLFKNCDRAVINLDDPAGAFMVEAAACPVVTYGIDNANGTLTAKNIRMSATGVAYEALISGDIQRVSLGIPGRFSVYNSLAAIGAMLALEMPLSDAASGLVKAQGVRGRAEVVYAGDFSVLVDYAHTPDGMENILKTARGFTEGRVVAVFGCGGDRDKGKRPKMGAIGVSLADVAVITSDNPRTEEPAAILQDILAGIDLAAHQPVVIEDRREAIRYAMNLAQKGDTVLILGKGHETYQEICGVKHPFDDREEVRAYAKELAAR